MMCFPMMLYINALYRRKEVTPFVFYTWKSNECQSRLEETVAQRFWFSTLCTVQEFFINKVGYAVTRRLMGIMRQKSCNSMWSCIKPTMYLPKSDGFRPQVVRIFIHLTHIYYNNKENILTVNWRFILKGDRKKQLIKKLILDFLLFNLCKEKYEKKKKNTEGPYLLMNRANSKMN